MYKESGVASLLRGGWLGTCIRSCNVRIILDELYEPMTNAQEHV